MDIRNYFKRRVIYMLENIYFIVSSIMGTISAASTIILCIQLSMSRRQSKNNHDERRREKTIEIMSVWNNSLHSDFRLAEKIVEGFDKQQCLNLYNYEPIKVREKELKLICELCSDTTCPKNKHNMCAVCTTVQNTQPNMKLNCEIQGEFYIIKGSQLNQLRWNVTAYLNNLETVFTAYFQGIVDKKVIEMQYSFLYKPEKNKNALSNYREIAGGGNSYPAIKSFIERLKELNEKSIEEKIEIESFN